METNLKIAKSLHKYKQKKNEEEKTIIKNLQDENKQRGDSIAETERKIYEVRQEDIQMERWYQEEMYQVNLKIDDAHAREKTAFLATSE